MFKKFTDSIGDVVVWNESTQLPSCYYHCGNADIAAYAIINYHSAAYKGEALRGADITNEEALAHFEKAFQIIKNKIEEE